MKERALVPLSLTTPQMMSQIITDSLSDDVLELRELLELLLLHEKVSVETQRMIVNH